jgi:large subunit ribosomal protein L4
MIEAPHYGSDGAKREAGFALPADYFDGSVNEPVLHQAVKVYLANQRQGTHATKTRRWVTGGNQKPWRQKGTGRARQGSTRAPHWPGGGTVFGPHPRDYRQDIPKKVRQLARRSALNARAREGSLWVIDGLALAEPKTARIAALFDAMGLDGRKLLVLTHGVNRTVYLSCRNLPTVDVMPYQDVSAYDVLWADAVLVERGALTGEALPIEPLSAEPPARPTRPRARKRPAADDEAPRKTPAARRGAKKPAAKKPAKAKAARKPATKRAAPRKKGKK